MKLVCPACGGVCAAEAFLNDATAREAIALVAQLPPGVARSALNYLALFRGGVKKSLAWSKVVRLLTELLQEIRQEYIQWQAKPARPNSAHAWQLALEKILENPPRQLPLKSHGYLKAIAYEIADEFDKTRERNVIAAEQSGSRAALSRAKAADQPHVETPSFEEMRKMREKHKVGKVVK